MSSTYIIFVLIFFFLGAVAFSLMINSILLRFIKTPGTKNQPQPVMRWSSESKPAIGGLSLFILFLFSFSFSMLFIDDSNQLFENKTILGLITAATLAFIMGLADDAYNTRPLLKFIVQIICGLILAYTGTVITIFDNESLNIALTVFWVVSLMNSINMLDNMDAIAAIISAFIVLAGLIVLGMNGNYFDIHFVILLGILAAILGFLFFNWHPSRMFMGDTGSQFLGVIIAYVGIKFCWNMDAYAEIQPDFGSWIPLIAVGLIFLLPITDTTIVSFSRILRGHSPFVGGKDHTTHNLSHIGLSDSQVAYVVIVISSISIGCFLLLKFHSAQPNLILMFLLGIYILVVFLILAIITLRNNKARYIKNNFEEQ